MARTKYDPYYRGFPSNVQPARTPFSRAGTADAGHLFIYMTNRRRLSLLLDRDRKAFIYEEVWRLIPVGYSQLWLFEKLYSTRRSRRRKSVGPSIQNFDFDRFNPDGLDRRDWAGKLIVVFREPYPYSSPSRPIISYHADREEAIDAADAYSLLKNRRAVAGLLLWDVQWH